LGWDKRAVDEYCCAIPERPIVFRQIRNRNDPQVCTVMFHEMKKALKAIIRYAVSHAPWGARNAILDACLDRLRFGETYSHLLPRCKLVEIAATGDRGVVASASTDTMVICEYAMTGTFAETVTEVLKNFFAAAGGTYIDIGANIGLMTIPFARNPLIHCMAFEPDPVNFGFLKRNVARNAPDSSVEFHQIALYHTRASLALALAEGNIGDHRLTINGVPGRRTVEVVALPLDDFLNRVSGPLAVKIDTQGAEPFIIAGGEKVLAQADLLVMEFCPYLMRELGGDPEIPINLVTGFSRVAIMPGGKSVIPEYENPAEAVARLRAKLTTARDTDEDYLDVIAVRGKAVVSI
jgi:FkbM family methyltransferase